ncbi:MAG: 1-deoxy-D-xylulose-5-phosphate synthase [Lachnospiraceae bacterium]|nr:1-deoxy-D-xylulose-5-phosphate synthase [Lachnospiraceae bacterium]
MLLDRIKTENDIKKIDAKDYPALAQEIRDFLIEKTSEMGGHLGANLGAVELTMALHLVLDLPKDKLIWDVGHQSYTHKLLTGRKDGFDSLRKYGGMSGFPKRKESDCDAFDTGHSSTSISAGLGYTKARDLKGEDYTVVSVIGDGSLTGGMAYEALNNAAELDTNFIIVLNDNNMSISESHGGMNRYLNAIRTSDTYMSIKDSIYYGLLEKPGYGQKVVKGIQNVKNSIKQLVIPGMYFEDMGLKYLGPVDGHDIKTLMRTMQEAKTVKGAVIVHVVTQKGRGYEPAQNHPARFHGAEPFDIATGLPKKRKEKPNYTDIFATMINKMAEADENIVAITAAMPDGTGLKRFSHKYEDRFFDVGIAEEHAVTFAAGLAAGGLHPVVAVYSSFLQRAYDQIIHDVCLQNLPVIFAIDRAGLVGSDGETHQGIFDISFLNTIPNMTVMAPKNKWELADMLLFAKDFAGPIAIRYPRGLAYDGLREYREDIALGKAEVLKKGSGIALFALGSMIPTAMAVAERLSEEGQEVSVVNARFAKPFDQDLLKDISKTHSVVVTMEENVITGGFGESVLTYCSEQLPELKVVPIALEDAYVEHGNTEILKKEHGIDEESIYQKIKGLGTKV